MNDATLCMESWREQLSLWVVVCALFLVERCLWFIFKLANLSDVDETTQR